MGQGEPAHAGDRGCRGDHGDRGHRARPRRALGADHRQRGRHAARLRRVTGESPLVGQWSTASIPSIGPTYGLGPLLFWLLAIPERLFGPGGYPVVMGLVNVACVMGSVALARRRGGPVLMVAAALGIAFVCRSLPTEVLASPFNPGASLLPFTLLTFLTWSVACGDSRLLPISVAVASLVAQCHLANALPRRSECS